MCGIVGIADLTGRHQINSDSLVAMRDTMVYRGPDDAGVEVLANRRVGFGHRRLAVISPTAEGRQPLTDQRSRTIVFNGEIYNYRELRTQLASRGHSFRTATDTEVILGAFAEWDLECLGRLRGMFAFAIWDPTSSRLVLARDRLGIKPLFYAVRDGALLFASEVRGLLAHPLVSAEPDLTSALDYLSFGYVPWDRSAFAAVHKLPPGEALVHDAAGIRTIRYWDPQPSERLRGDDAADAVEAAVADSVRSHLISDVPLGAFLSGGIDSSAVVACAARAADTPLRTISVGFDTGESELPYARAVATRYRTHHVEHMASAKDSIGLLERLADVFDEPLADTSAIPTDLICRAARRDVTVALSGDGGDELFAGYRWYGNELEPTLPGAHLIRQLVARARGLPRLARTAALLRRTADRAVDRHRYTMSLFDPWELSRLTGPSLAPALREYDPGWLFQKHFRPDVPLLTGLQLLDLRTFLVDDILVKVDRAGMASSLEIRPPLLDHNVVETAFSIHPDTMRRDGRGKWPLRRAMRDLVPGSIMTRSKRGFSAPISKWFRGDLGRSARRMIRGGTLVRAGWIDPSFVDWMIDNYTERRWAKLWALLVLEHWHARWIAR